MTLSSERRVVQNPLIRYAEEAGWTYLSPEGAKNFSPLLRHGPEQPLLQDVLIEQLQRLNPGVVTSAEQAAEVIARLMRLRPDIEGNREAWEYLKGLKTVFVQAERRERNLRLLDPQQVEANTFHVTDEFRFHSGPHKIRADVVFLVNGIPVILVETKAATRLEGIAEALRSGAPLSRRSARPAGANATLRPHPTGGILLRRYLVPFPQGALQLEGRDCGGEKFFAPTRPTRL